MAPRLPWPPEGVEYAIKMANELNASGWSWRLRSARRADQRRRTHKALAPYQPPVLPLTVEIRRLGWNMQDRTALAGSAKSVTDQIAEWLGVDDNDPRITWTFSQEIRRERETVVTRKGPATQCASRCRIVIRPREDRPPLVESLRAEAEAGLRWETERSHEPFAGDT